MLYPIEDNDETHRQEGIELSRFVIKELRCHRIIVKYESDQDKVETGLKVIAKCGVISVGSLRTSDLAGSVPTFLLRKGLNNDARCL
jgi:hypothetical protein